MLESIFVAGVVVRAGMHVLENKAAASYDASFITSTLRVALAWPIDIYDAIKG